MSPIDSVWENVKENWDSDETHRKFIALCASLGQLETAGRYYRAIRDSDESKREMAQKQIEQILSQAMSRLELTKTEPQTNPKRILFFVGLGVFSILILAALWIWLELAN